MCSTVLLDTVSYLRAPIDHHHSYLFNTTLFFKFGPHIIINPSHECSTTTETHGACCIQVLYTWYHVERSHPIWKNAGIVFINKQDIHNYIDYHRCHIRSFQRWPRLGLVFISPPLFDILEILTPFLSYICIRRSYRLVPKVLVTIHAPSAHWRHRSTHLFWTLHNFHEIGPLNLFLSTKISMMASSALWTRCESSYPVFHSSVVRTDRGLTK